MNTVSRHVQTNKKHFSTLIYEYMNKGIHEQSNGEKEREREREKKRVRGRN